tara:strand:- start:303 stop:959 length:657 start_codon:yes stop_codon:yes gene_type:complete
MECENSIKSIINNDIDNKYKIESKLLNRIKYRCSCDEPGDLPHYKHQNLKLSFDFNNYKLSQYINNNDELGLLELYKKYVENFHTNLINFKSKYNSNQYLDFYRTIEYLENQEEIYYLEEQIKNLIINLCYIKINDYVKKNYNTECYFIYDLNLDIKFIDDLCKYIYFEHYVNISDFTLNHSNILSLGYFMNKDRIYHTIKKLAYVNISGDIYYKQQK